MKAFLTKILSSEKFTLLFFLILGFLAYSTAIPGDFFFDDNPLIVNNEYIKSWAHVGDWFTSGSTAGSGQENSNLFRPLMLFSFTLIHSLFGLNPIAFHVVNIILHGITSFFLYKLLTRINFSQIAAFLGALFFLIHPVQTESVAYISGLPDVLVMLFLILGLSAYVQKKTILTLIFLILGFLTKEHMVVFFPLALLIDIYKWDEFETEEKTWHKKMWLALGALTLIFIILKFTVLSFTGNVGLSSKANLYTENIHLRIFAFLAALVEYIKISIFPLHLYFEKGTDLFRLTFTPQAFLGLIILCTSLLAAWSSLKKEKLFFLAALWFLIALGPVSGIIPQNAVWAEHWLYIPLAGFSILIAGGYDLISDRRKQTFLIIALIITLLFTGRTIHRNIQWGDSFKFTENEIRYNAQSHLVYNKLGKELVEIGKYEEAAIEFEKAAAINEVNPQARVNLCLTYYLMKKFPEAEQNCDKAIELDDKGKEQYMILYNIYAETNQVDKAAILVPKMEQLGIIDTK